MTPYRISQLLGVWAVVTIAHASGGKGSESHEVSKEGSSETEASAKGHAGKRKNTGAQKKFWIPTYPGSNPLNRRKIDITNSEIERFDSSVDESLSGVIKNGTRAPSTKKNDPRSQEKDLSKLPFVWSGEDIAHNITVKDLASLDSSLVTVESEISSEDDSTEFKKNYSPFAWNKSNRSDTSSEESSSDQSESYSSSESSSGEPVSRKVAQRDQRRVETKKTNIRVTPKQVSQNVSSRIKTKITKKTLKLDPKLTKKSEVSYSSDKSEATTNENILSREYYKKMVEAAVENTKRKLGYQKLSKTSQLHQTFKPIVPDSLMIDSEGSEPEIFKVNMDRKSFEKAKSEEEINFKTKHDQFATRSQLDTVKRRNKEKSEEKKERVKTLARDLVGKPKDKNFKWNLTESKLDEIYKKQKAVDFPSSCDYDAWSDVLLLNRTQRKSKQRKPKTGKLSSSYERSSGDMRAWPGKNIRGKAEELRKKEGKLTRKEKRKRAQKKVEKRQKEKKGAKRKYGDRYNDDYRDSTESGKERTGKKIDLEYDYKGDDYSHNESQKKGKGGSRKQIDYDNSYDEKDFNDTPKEGKRKPVKEKGYGEKKDYDSDKPMRKFRMTTEGEKRHAYKEVKSYLNEMDEEYGGRPGGETFRDRKRGKGYGRSESRDRGRGWDRRGDERGKFSTGGRGRGGFERGRDNWNDRGRRGGWDDRRGGGLDDRRGGGWGDRRGGGWDDRRGGGWDDQRGGGWDDQRGGGWDDRRGGRWGRDERDKGRDRRGMGRDDRRNTGRGGRSRGGWSRGRGGRGRGGRGGGRGRS